MKVRIFTMFSLIVSIALLLAVLLGGTMPTTAQGPEPPRLTKPLSGPPLLPGNGPYRAIDGTWYMPAGAMPPEGPSTSVSPQDTGGPDDFGYTWDDSVAFNWIDATTGTNTGLEGDDEYTDAIDIGFNFKFYENTYSQLYITTNGLVTFGEGTWDPINHRIPNSGWTNNFIAAFWSDLCVNFDDYNTGTVYYVRGGGAPNRYFVVEWHEVSPLGSTDRLTFEVILHENGDIVVQYLSLSGCMTSATVGIEDDIGIDGLQYLYNSSGLENNKAVRFYRPGPMARIKVWPLYQGRFTHAGETVAFQMSIRNTGELGADTYDLFVSSPWSVGLYAADGTTPLTDTDSDGAMDTGSVAQGGSTTIVVKVTTPGTANVDDDNSADITVSSSLDTGKSKTVSLQTAVPAPFAQVFRDDADEAMSLYLVQPAAQAVKKATSDWYCGYEVAVAEMPDSFAYFWGPHYPDDVGSFEIEYTLLDRYGETVRGVSELTNHSSATVRTHDFEPAVAVAPNGRIGVVWRRRLNSDSDDWWNTWNYNIYYAVLDGSGDVVVPPTNLTNNPFWGSGGAPVDVPLFGKPTIAATTDNRFVLAWYQDMNTADGSITDIQYTIRDTSGAQVKAVTEFTNDTPGCDERHAGPNLAQLSGGRVLLTWECHVVPAYDYDICYAVLDSAGHTVKNMTNASGTSGFSFNVDAVALSNGNSVIAWHEWQSDRYKIAYTVLDTAYNVLLGSPAILSHPATVTGDVDISVAADSTGHAILTWMDSDWAFRGPSQNLYYALVNGNGNVLTDPMIFRTSQATEDYIFTSNKGYGNTSYSWTPPSDVDGLAALNASLFSGPPGGNAAMSMRYANHGATTATGVVLTATLDSNLTYAGDTSVVTPTVSGNDVVWSLPDLDFLDSHDFTLYLQVPSGAAYGTRYPVTLTLSSDGPEANAGDNTDSAEVMATRQVFLPLICRGY